MGLLQGCKQVSMRGMRAALMQSRLPKWLQPCSMSVLSWVSHSPNTVLPRWDALGNSWLVGSWDSPATLLADGNSKGNGFTSSKGYGCSLPARGQPGRGPPLAVGTPQRQSLWSAWLLRLPASRVHLQEPSSVARGPKAQLLRFEPVGDSYGYGTACSH